MIYRESALPCNPIRDRLVNAAAYLAIAAVVVLRVFIPVTAVHAAILPTACFGFRLHDYPHKQMKNYRAILVRSAGLCKPLFAHGDKMQ